MKLAFKVFVKNIFFNKLQYSLLQKICCYCGQMNALIFLQQRAKQPLQFVVFQRNLVADSISRLLDSAWVLNCIQVMLYVRSTTI